MATYRKRKPSARALNAGLWVLRLLIGGSSFQGRCPPQRLRMGAVQNGDFQERCHSLAAFQAA
jgi:hypothetical protein